MDGQVESPSGGNAIPRRMWVGLLMLAPFALIALATQIALLAGVAGAGVLLLGGYQRDSGLLVRGASTVQLAGSLLDRAWSSPPAALLQSNPVSLGLMDEVRGSLHAAAQATGMLVPLAELGSQAVGFDGREPLVSGSTVDVTRVATLVGPSSELHDSLLETKGALDRVPRTGLLGGPLGGLAENLSGGLANLIPLAEAAEAAMPGLPDALGATEPKRYLICALNDAELFGSGGAPLFAAMIEAERGTLSIPLSGQMESKLSPGNPPIEWDHEGGPPWYRDGKTYPFVNSNFHPDFPTAARDMTRAWAALGYPRVDGVLTVDVNALAEILRWIGPIESGGYGVLDAENLIPTILVDAYRESDSIEGRIERHARNDQLADRLVQELAEPANLVPAVRGLVQAIPERHVQAAFTSRHLQSAVSALEATGALSNRPGDAIGAFSQSSPNKLSVFHARRIDHEVQLTPLGGATVRRTVTMRNAVPEGSAGNPDTWIGYSALQARLRVAHRVPLVAEGPTIATADPAALVPARGTGPFPDERGGQVLWQGHVIPQGQSAEVVVEYQLPDGTFPPGGYAVSADPQALTIPAELRITVRPAAGQPVPSGPGWESAAGAAIWSGALDRPLRLEVG